MQPCVPERMNFYIRRRWKIIASERTERSNPVVSMGLELFFFCGGRCMYVRQRLKVETFGCYVGDVSLY